MQRACTGRGWAGSVPGLLRGLRGSFRVLQRPPVLGLGQSTPCGWSLAICPPRPHRLGALQSPGAALEVAGEQASDGSVWFCSCRTLCRTPGAERQGAAGQNSPFQPIHIGDADHLEEGQEDEVHGSQVVVENLEPVAPRLQREARGRQKADQTDRPCGQTPRLGSRPWALSAPRRPLLSAVPTISCPVPGVAVSGQRARGPRYLPC